MKKIMGKTLPFGMVCALVILLGTGHAYAVIEGITGTSFALTAKEGMVSTPDGGSIYSWGFAEEGGPMQYPGPTLLLSQGDSITVTLTNELPPAAGNVSIVFPGHDVTASGGVTGLLTREAQPGGGKRVTYTFTADKPGTFTYYSGTNTALQTDMGLFGAVIVYPDTPNQAYDHADSAYDYEYLFLLSEMDQRIHDEAAEKCHAAIDTTDFFPTNWFINGRCAPDTMAPARVEWLPSQPYNCWPRMHPGDKLLMRMIGGGRDLHPFHHHGNNATVIAIDGRLLSSGPGAGANLAYSDFTLAVSPGQTLDAIFEWTGEDLGWDLYGHQQDIDNPPMDNFPGPEDVDHNGNGVFDSVPLATNEYAPDHGKPFPVTLPADKELTFGGMWSGSPYLGSMENLPPGEGGMNMYGAFTYMWHSHNEKEMTNFDIFPGGMMTMSFIEPPGVVIP